MNIAKWYISLIRSIVSFIIYWFDFFPKLISQFFSSAPLRDWGWSNWKWLVWYIWRSNLYHSTPFEILDSLVLIFCFFTRTKCFISWCWRLERLRSRSRFVCSKNKKRNEIDFRLKKCKRLIIIIIGEGNMATHKLCDMLIYFIRVVNETEFIVQEAWVRMEQLDSW